MICVVDFSVCVTGFKARQAGDFGFEGVDAFLEVTAVSLEKHEYQVSSSCEWRLRFGD